jgi:hypothetical protein
MDSENDILTRAICLKSRTPIYPPHWGARTKDVTRTVLEIRGLRHLQITVDNRMKEIYIQVATLSNILKATRVCLSCGPM